MGGTDRLGRRILFETEDRQSFVPGHRRRRSRPRLPLRSFPATAPIGPIAVKPGFNKSAALICRTSTFPIKCFELCFSEARETPAAQRPGEDFSIHLAGIVVKFHGEESG